jgi:hypothetical protein
MPGSAVPTIVALPPERHGSARLTETVVVSWGRSRILPRRSREILDRDGCEPDGELKATEDALAREETNLASYAQQLSDAFEYHDTLLAAQRELGAIERKLTSGAADAVHSVATQEVPAAA